MAASAGHDQALIFRRQISTFALVSGISVRRLEQARQALPYANRHATRINRSLRIHEHDDDGLLPQDETSQAGLHCGRSILLADTNMKLQNTVPAPPATAEALAEQTRSDESPAQAGSLAAQRDALREALPSRNAGEGSSRTARRSGASILRSMASASAGGGAHGAQRAQAFAVRQSEEIQIQDDGTEESIALPQELDTAIATWANDAIDQATTVKAGDDTQLSTGPTHQRVTRDGRRQQPRGRQHQSQERSPGQSQEQSHDESQEQGKQEARAAAAESGDSVQSAQGVADGPVDHALARGHAQRPAPIGELPRQPRSGARSTARIAPLAAAAPAQRQVDELDSTRVAGKSNSDVLAALMWAMAAMVVVIISTLLFTLFSDDTPETAPEPAGVHPTHQDAAPDMQKSQELRPSGGHHANGHAPNV